MKNSNKIIRKIILSGCILVFLINGLLTLPMLDVKEDKYNDILQENIQILSSSSNQTVFTNTSGLYNCNIIQQYYNETDKNFNQNTKDFNISKPFSDYSSLNTSIKDLELYNQSIIIDSG